MIDDAPRVLQPADLAAMRAENTARRLRQSQQPMTTGEEARVVGTIAVLLDEVDRLRHLVESLKVPPGYGGINDAGTKPWLLSARVHNDFIDDKLAGKY